MTDHDLREYLQRLEYGPPWGLFDPRWFILLEQERGPGAVKRMFIGIAAAVAGILALMLVIL